MFWHNQALTVSSIVQNMTCIPPCYYYILKEYKIRAAICLCPQLFNVCFKNKPEPLVVCHEPDGFTLQLKCPGDLLGSDVYRAPAPCSGLSLPWGLYCLLPSQWAFNRWQLKVVFSFFSFLLIALCCDITKKIILKQFRLQLLGINVKKNLYLHTFLTEGEDLIIQWWINNYQQFWYPDKLFKDVRLEWESLMSTCQCFLTFKNKMINWLIIIRVGVWINNVNSLICTQLISSPAHLSAAVRSCYHRPWPWLFSLQAASLCIVLLAGWQREGNTHTSHIFPVMKITCTNAI